MFILEDLRAKFVSTIFDQCACGRFDIPGNLRIDLFPNFVSSFLVLQY